MPDIQIQILLIVLRPGGRVIFIIPGIQRQAGENLLQVIGAFGFLAGEAFTLARSFPRLVQRRQQHRRQNRDNRNHHKKFNKCEPQPILPHNVQYVAFILLVFHISALSVPYF